MVFQLELERLNDDSSNRYLVILKISFMLSPSLVALRLVFCDQPPVPLQTASESNKPNPGLRLITFLLMLAFMQTYQSPLWE